MLLLKMFLIAGLGIMIVLLIIFLIVSYFCQNSGDKVIRLSFKDFYKYYCLNPKSWIIDYDMLKKTKDWHNNHYCRIKFWSYPKYCWFVYNYKKGRENAKNKEEYINFLQSVQTDIDNCRADAEKYMNKGTNILKNINYKDLTF